MSQYGPPEHPYGQPQLPPQQPPYGQGYAPQQAQPGYGQQSQYPPQPPRSQALAIITLITGVVALAAALWVVSRGVALFIGLVALILGIVALVNKRQGGTALAIIGLTAGMVAMALALILWIFTVGQETANQQQQQQIADCIENEPENILSCSGLD